MTQITIEADALRSLVFQPRVDTIEGVPCVLAPDGKLTPHASLLPKPLRIERAFKAHDVRGLIDYILRFNAPPTAIYCGPADNPKLRAIFDDHQPGAPNNNAHVAEYPCPITQEWKDWTGRHKNQMSQVDFAEFIENHLKDITSPPGAEMLQAVLSFRDLGSADFKSAVRLSDGRVQFNYIEKEEAKGAAFPERMTLALPVFEGIDTRYEVIAKLRYRIIRGDEVTLALWYELSRPDLVARAAYDKLIAHVETATGLKVIRGL